MPTIVALFSELNPLDEARAALERAGFGEDLQRVIDQGTLDGTRSPAAAGARRDGTLLSFGRTTPASDMGPLDEIGLDEEEAGFLRRSVEDGARVMVVRTDRPAEAEEVLAPYAQRMVRTDA